MSRRTRDGTQKRHGRRMIKGDTLSFTRGSPSFQLGTITHIDEHSAATRA